ncbi:MAG: hypothetical protein ACXACU_07755 [Candidatus Hodarchaeales archaeon]
MINSHRRLYLNNWAILTEADEVKWHFGDIKGDKLLQTIDFVNALSRMGGQIVGQGVGIVRLRYPKPHPTLAREIMVVNLLDKYNVVISDPLVTTRLFNRIELKDAPWDEIRSILAGSASVIYSDFYSKEDSILSSSIVDNMFQEAVNAVTYNKKVTVANGECSFSALSFEELLFFHAILRKLFESYVSTNAPSPPWGVISAKEGVPVYLEDRAPVDYAMISAFSSLIVSYCDLLFGAFPSRLVFGAHSINGMDFITTEKNMFVVNNPQRLLKLQRFIRKWKKIPIEVALDLAPAMKTYFTELALIKQRERMKNLELHQIINSLTQMGIRRARKYRLRK